MATLINPYHNFKILDELLDEGGIAFSPVKGTDLHCHLDFPDDMIRMIYAKFIDNKIAAICVFVKGDNLHELPCFDIGYAVRDIYQQQGLGAQVVTSSLDAFKSFLAEQELYEFAIEAVVGRDNLASNTLAKRALGVEGLKTTDVLSGTPVFAYQKYY